MKKILYILIALTIASVANAAPKKWNYFDAMDKDKDGKVTEAEWVARSKVQHKKNNKTFNETAVKGWFKGNDTDKNGTLSRQEVDTISNKNTGKKNKKKKK